MGLNKYKRKRKFSETPEPSGGASEDEQLHFVVQKHKASRLHYDLRLEMAGVLKSWAVPKGPSLNPADKRLAIQVDDHPLDYRDFEGIIPKGNYGAGTVIVWDQGSLETLEQADRDTMEKSLLKQLKAGSIKFRLKGQKLKGEFALVKMNGEEENAWLLIKHDDENAAQKEVTLLPQSVLSGKTLEEVAASFQKPVDNGRSGNKKATDEPNEQKAKKEEAVLSDEQIGDLLKKAPSTPFPSQIAPMLAKSASAPFDDVDWVFEAKWDGYRAIAYLHGDKASLKSRNGQSLNKKFPPIKKAIDGWNTQAVVDGEIVAITKTGLPSFSKLQNWKEGSEVRLLYYVFDLLWYNGKDMTSLPLTERQGLLRTLLPEGNATLRMGHSVRGSGKDFFHAAAELGLEGIVAKRLGGKYFPGKRSSDWLKIKSKNRQEVVIGGYTRLEGSPRLFSALLLGIYQGETLNYVGKVGTGFKEEEQKELLGLFSNLEREKSPFHAIEIRGRNSFVAYPSKKEVVTWLLPQLVCKVSYSERTPTGMFRHPVFIALREDKEATDVTEEIEDKEKASTMRHSKKDSPATATKNSEGTWRVGDKTLKITNLQKVLWPDDGYTKQDMLEYYRSVSRFLLPYLRNRPQSLNRFPNGINGKSFYQKDVTGKVPDWIEQYPYKTDDERKQKHYMLCNNKATLMYMVNWGTIELNPWNSTILSPVYPTWCAFDLDPDHDNTFAEVIEVARAIHDFLEELRINSYCKTSGSTGIHIYVPLQAKYTFDQCQLFAKWVAHEVDALFPFTSVERMTDKRKGKIYIDFLQNRQAATLAAPYSLRPKPGATVSMPLYWEEVKSTLKITDFTLSNAEERLQQEGDIFKPVLGKGIDLKKILKELK
jgi:bifunctional non-homologous end joining protein LigD